MIAARVIRPAVCLGVVIGLASAAAIEPQASNSSQNAGIVEQAANALNAVQQAIGLEKCIRVVDLKGNPVAGATVSVWAFHSAQGYGPWRKGGGLPDPPTVKTDAEGRATIPFPEYGNPTERIPMDELTCVVKHSDFATTRYNEVNVRPASLTEEAEIRLAPGARITLIPKAETVELDRQRLFVIWSSPTDSYEFEVTPAGWFVLPRLPAGPQLIRLVYLPEVGKPMFSAVLTETLVDGDDLQRALELRSSVTVTGVIDESVPRPIRQGILSAMTIESTSDVFNKLSWRTMADIDADGRFCIEDVPANSDLQIIALCDGYMASPGKAPDSVPERDRKIHRSLSVPQVFHAGDTDLRIALAMTPTVECIVKVVDPAGEPIGGAKLFFGPNVKWWNGGTQIYCHPRFSTREILMDKSWRTVHQRDEQASPFAATTGADGVALVRNLPPTSHSFGVSAEGFEVPIDGNSRQRRIDLRAGGRHELIITLQAKSPRRLGDLPQALLDACQIIGTGSVLVKPLPSANNKQ
jgi:hypothetical protein